MKTRFFSIMQDRYGCTGWGANPDSAEAAEKRARQELGAKPVLIKTYEFPEDYIAEFDSFGVSFSNPNGAFDRDAIKRLKDWKAER